MDAEHFFKNMRHINITCPYCKEHHQNCKQVYHDEFHGEYICRTCGLVIR